MLEGESPYDTLLSLLEKGLVCADSFVPVRQWLNQDKLQKAAARQRVGARVKVLQAGRFDLVKPLRPLTIQEQMERCFDRYVVLCRETAAAWGLSWQEALKLLRVWEYTGQVRRGYFVRGLSGAQFLRRQDFESVTSRLMHPQAELAWLNAADPKQPWGKLLTHEPGRSFLNVPGTAVAFRDGLPIAVFERQGKVLRLLGTEKRQGDEFQDSVPVDGGRQDSILRENILRENVLPESILQADVLCEALALFAEEFRRGRIFPEKKRISVKEYPKQAAEALVAGGFLHEIQDYVLYR